MAAHRETQTNTMCNMVFTQSVRELKLLEIYRFGFRKITSWPQWPDRLTCWLTDLARGTGFSFTGSM